MIIDRDLYLQLLDFITEGVKVGVQVDHRLDGLAVNVKHVFLQFFIPVDGRFHANIIIDDVHGEFRKVIVRNRCESLKLLV